MQADEFVRQQSDKISDVFQHTLTGWQLHTKGTDRHGSWEWVAYQRRDDLDRYLVLDFTPIADEILVAELFGELADVRQFTRLPMRKVTFTITHPDVLDLVLNWLTPAKNLLEETTRQEKGVERREYQ